MALITCPQCGKVISDKADHCVHCGYKLEKPIPKRVCSECGAELRDDDKFCHNCGAPVENITSPKDNIQDPDETSADSIIQQTESDSDHDDIQQTDIDPDVSDTSHTNTDSYDVDTLKTYDNELEQSDAIASDDNTQQLYNVPLDNNIEYTGASVITPKKDKKKLIIVIAVIAIIAIIAILLGVQHAQKVQAEKEQERKEAYAKTMTTSTNLMISSAEEAEKCGDLMLKVWQNSVFQDRDSETDKYTRPDGYFVSDFNDALANLFADSEYRNKISGLEKDQKNIHSYMQDLKDPPEELEDYYDAESKMYNAYMKFTNMVIEPLGSLNTFSDNYNNAKTDLINSIKEFTLYAETNNK